MKNDDNKPDMKTWIDPELEARVVAWVAGEASPFEIAELERIVAAQPELAVFKRRVEAVHGLVREAARPDPTPLLLAPERRAKLLAILEGTEKKEPAAVAAPEKSKVISFHAGWQRAVGRYAWIGGVAAVATFCVFVATQRTMSFSEAKARINRERQMIEQAQDVALPLALIAGEETRKETVDTSVPRVNMAVTADAFALRSPDAVGADYSLKQKAQVAADGQMPFGFMGGRGGEVTLGLPASAPAQAKSAEFNRMMGLGSLTLGQSDADRGQSRSVSGSGPVSFDRPATIGGMAGGAVVGGSNRYTGTVSGSTVTLNANLEDAASLPVKMEPFVVEAEKDTGYFASNSMAGTRLSTPPLPGPLLSAVSSAVTTQDSAVKLEAFEVATPTKSGRGGFSAGFGGGAKKDANPAPAMVFAPPAGGPDMNLPVDVSNVQAPSSLAISSAAPALAESRVNTGLADQAGSISVVTKSFMVDAPVTGFAPLPPADKETDDAKRPAPAAPAEPPSTEETSTAKEPVSTFSLHVSDVSFRLAQAALARGQLPDAALIRPEEIYNAFDYGDPSPATAEKVGTRIEQAAHPFLQQRNLVRIAVKVPATGRSASQPLKLTVLLDTSGSMEREDRVTTVRRALEVLISLLGPQDRVTLIGFARQPRLLAEDVAGDRAKGLLELIARTPSEGGTNLEAALKLGGELARRHQQLSAQNRIVVLTDGAANLGDADPARLARMVEELRNQGIAFDACGVGLNGLDDAMLEPLTRKGDGRYYVLDSAESADAGFARQLAGAFRPAAENVKLQVRFNPGRVANYRLIGFEQHRLKTEDFRNDRVDAAELAAEEAAVAVYQVEALPSGEGELGEVSVRFRDAADGAMVERTWTMIYDAQAPAFDRATPSLQIAGVAALVAEKLRGSPQADQFKLGDFAGVVNGLRSHYASQVRVQEFAAMFATLRRIRGE